MHFLIIPLILAGTLGLGWIVDYFTNGSSTYTLVYSVSRFLFDLTADMLGLVNSDFLMNFSFNEQVQKLPETILQVATQVGLPEVLQIFVSSVLIYLGRRIFMSAIGMFK